MKTIKFIYYFLRIVLFPNDVRNLLRLGDYVMEAAPHNLFDSALLKNPYLRHITEARYMGEFPEPSPVDSISETRFEAGSLGDSYIKHLLTHKITPYSATVSRREFLSNNDYLKERVRYLRDTLRLLLNLGTTYEDEAALNAFLFSQVPSPLPAAVVGGIILRAVFQEPASLQGIFKKVVQAYRCGECSRNFLTIRWETMWEMSLDEAREQLIPDRSIYEEADQASSSLKLLLH